MRILTLLCLLLLTNIASAQDAATPQASPRAEQAAALAPFFSDGGTHGYYMGREAGLDGWFLTMSGNRIQIAYTSPDGKVLVIGALFAADGANLTEKQLVALRAREPEVNKLFTDSVEQAQQKLVKTSGMDRIMKNLDPTKKGDQLYLELAQMFHAQVGPRDAPLLFMVIDPTCPHCKRAWKEMAPLIGKTGVQVRVIPVGILGDEATRMAGKLLDSDRPGEVWAKFAAANFDKSVLDGTPGQTGVTRAQLNRSVFDRWQLKATPFFAYRSKSGEVKVLNQEPADIEALLRDIAAVPPPSDQPAAGTGK